MKIFSIGYAAFTFNQFIEQLKIHNIATLVDVRSIPYSKISPKFTKKNLEKLLPQNDINYRYLGDLLGGKSYPPYPQHMQTQRFKLGLKTLENITQRPVVLMCVEPAEEKCHRRFILTALNERGYEIITILPLKKQKPSDKQSSLKSFIK